MVRPVFFFGLPTFRLLLWPTSAINLTLNPHPSRKPRRMGHPARGKLIRELRNLDKERLELLDQMGSLAK
jgi:hypothetical protein